MWWLMPLALSAAPLSFEEALARADAAPEQVAARDAVGVRRDGLAHLGRLTSNPTLSLQPGFRTEGEGPRPEGQLTLSQGFNLGGLSSARRGAAAAELEAARLGVTRSRTERRVAVARAWLETWAAQRLHDPTLAEADAAKALVAKLERLVAGGGVTTADVASARAFAAEAAAFHLSWEGRRFEAGAHLALLLGLPDVVTVAPEAPSLAALEVDLSVAEALPEARLRAREAEAAERRVAEAQAQYSTQLQLSLQGGHEAPTQWYGNVGVGVTLPLFERGQRDVARARAEATQLEGLKRQASAAARVTLQLLAHELEHAAEVFEVVHRTQQPAAEEAARLETRRFEQGEATLLELLLVRRQALQATAAAVEAQAGLLAARVAAREVLESGRTP